MVLVMSELQTLNQYWAMTRPTIEEEYRFGTTTNYCRVVAEQIAQILHGQGETPQIAKLEHPLSLIPVMYERRIRWQWHEVCAAQGLAFDPIHELPPMTIENYITSTFMKPELIRVSYREYEPLE